MQYQIGKATVINNSQIVTGVNTVWLTNVFVGSLFKISGNNNIYQIGSVDSNTQITLTTVYAGVSLTESAYQIVVDFTPNFSIPEIWIGDKDWPYHLTQALRKIDTLVADLWVHFAKGYILGGYTDANTAVIEDLIFSNETSQAIAATLDTAKRNGAGVQYGYI